MIDWPAHGTIIDIGANFGAKSELFLHLSSRVIAIVPDPDAAERLRARFRWRAVEVRQLAVGHSGRPITLFKFRGSEAYNTANPRWAASTDRIEFEDWVPGEQALSAIERNNWCYIELYARTPGASDHSRA